jgi:hypothetical protein
LGAQTDRATTMLLFSLRDDINQMYLFHLLYSFVALS